MTTSHSSQRIVVGTDGSPNSHRAISWAVEHAHAGDTVVIVHAWQPFVYGSELAMAYTIDDAESGKILESDYETFKGRADERGIALEKVLVQADARTALKNQNADILVVGARGHGAFLGALLGSVADYYARHSDVPVVIIPSEPKK
jgi:nucleotide-binding universal stress UspA family protein